MTHLVIYYNSDGLEDVVSIGSLQIPAAVPSLHGRTIDLEQHHLDLRCGTCLLLSAQRHRFCVERERCGAREHFEAQ